MHIINSLQYISPPLPPSFQLLQYPTPVFNHCIITPHPPPPPPHTSFQLLQYHIPPLPHQFSTTALSPPTPISHPPPLPAPVFNHCSITSPHSHTSFQPLQYHITPTPVFNHCSITSPHSHTSFQPLQYHIPPLPHQFSTTAISFSVTPTAVGILPWWKRSVLVPDVISLSWETHKIYVNYSLECVSVVQINPFTAMMPLENDQ